ncbi:4-(cytidine 5'-diphospho)-2-C-methyl-D-erythritol kinase [uncultured Tateyamaria sp.]|uniref:4-(cytidine 5'-diphospho)-2-C-methyl-D-erythritol kinase n=1 Tax=uncultured Tateyamaria sp. TaxID=455651 RepID=UPI002635FAC4|nr:4-(cytidine 5'-diphospho)-2-C-methyl-D-erythritol kinase [uncultured Tateyamaria sp.]
MTIEAFAPAKINLTLHVTGQRDDGYHLLDSFVVFADVGDRLRLTPGDALSLDVTGPFADGVPTDARNLAWRAADLAGWTGHIEIEKNLPHGAGIGGGSADAAAVLRALGAGPDALALGADVPVCMVRRAARMGGIGDVVTPVADDPTFFAVLVNPGLHVATPKVFARLQRKDNAGMAPLPPRHSGMRGWLDWLRAQRNDLQAPAMAIAPGIDRVLRGLEAAPGVLVTRMSGSGATCFGLFPTRSAAQFAASAIAAERPDWWCVPATLS